MSLPEIPEEKSIQNIQEPKNKSTNDIKDPVGFIDTLQLTAEQEDMLQKTLKKHSLNADIWKTYLENKLNSYNSFGHEVAKKLNNTLDLHIEIAKFEQEYE